jgi:hydroxypyruvate isomerase
MTPVSRRLFLGASAAAAGAVSLGGRTSSAAVAGKLPGQTPNTKFAVNVEMWFTDLPFLDRLRASAKLGFPAVEFWPWDNKDLKAVAELSKELNLAIAQFTAWGFEPGMNDPKNHQAFVEAVDKGCEVAKQLDCKLMTVVGGNDQPGMSQEKMHENIITALKMAAPIAEKNDITLILEPMNIRVDHKGHCLYGSEKPVRICRAVNSTHVKINWDLYHMQISEGDLCGRLKDGFDQVGYLQVADNPGRNEPGTGEVHYNRVLRQAKELGYTGYVGLECRPRDGEVKAAERVAAADVW